MTAKEEGHGGDENGGGDRSGNTCRGGGRARSRSGCLSGGGCRGKETHREERHEEDGENPGVDYSCHCLGIK